MGESKGTVVVKTMPSVKDGFTLMQSIYFKLLNAPTEWVVKRWSHREVQAVCVSIMVFAVCNGS